jgi:hypothetical protein
MAVFRCLECQLLEGELHLVGVEPLREQGAGNFFAQSSLQRRNHPYPPPLFTVQPVDSEIGGPPAAAVEAHVTPQENPGLGIQGRDGLVPALEKTPGEPPQRLETGVESPLGQSDHFHPPSAPGDGGLGPVSTFIMPPLDPACTGCSIPGAA